jgi:hypothetical protein
MWDFFWYDTSMRLKSSLSFIPFIIACIAAVVVVIQTTRVTPLFDYSYQVEAAYRIYHGEIPYRDFFLVVPPGTYIILATLMAITGGYSHIATVIFTACLAGFSVLLLNSILVKLKTPIVPRLFILLIVPLTGHGIYPWPNYDVYSGIVLSILYYVLLSESLKRIITVKFAFLFGLLSSILLVLKQTTGIAYGTGVIIVFLLTYFRYPTKQSLRIFLAIVTGLLIPVAVGYIILNISGILPKIINQTVVFARSIRQPEQAIGVIMSQYVYYFSTILQQLPYLILFLLPLTYYTIRKTKLSNLWIFIINAALLVFLAVKSFQGISAITSIKDQYNSILLMSWLSFYVVYVLLLPFIWLRTTDKQLFLVRLFPLAFIITAHGTYLTHHVVGSSYGLWPIFIIIMGINISVLKESFPRLVITPIIALCVAFVLYALIENYQTRMFFDYVDLSGSVQQSSSPRFTGAGTPGIWMAELDHLLIYVSKNISTTDSVVITPGDEPFYALTGRISPLPILIFHREVFPLDNMDFPKYFARRGVQWVIAKTITQLYWQFGYIDLTRPEFGLTRYYNKVTQIGIYEIYKRNSNN